METLILGIIAVCISFLFWGLAGLRAKNKELSRQINGQIHGARNCFKKSLDLNSKHMHGHVEDLRDAIRTLDESQTFIGNDLFQVVKVLAGELGYELTFTRPQGESDIQRINHTMGGPVMHRHALLKLEKKKKPVAKKAVKRKR